MFDEQDYHMMYGIRRSPNITLEVPMELYPHFLGKLTGSGVLELDTPAGVMDCYILRIAPAANLISRARRFFEVTLQPTGVPKSKATTQFQLEHPNCRSVMGIDWDAPTKEKPVKIKNRFYVASPSVTKPAEQTDANTVPTELAVQPSDVGRNKKWTRNSLKDAVDHATAMLEADPKLEHVAISKIVTVVRRKKAPVVVEHLK